MVRAVKLFNRDAKVADDVVLDGPLRLGAVVVDRGCKFGKYTYVGAGSRIGKDTVIGSYCSIVRNVEIAATEHPTHFLSTHPFQYSKKLFDEIEAFEKISRVKRGDEGRPTIIENDVWIGTKAIIKRGVTIGTGAIIGGGALVVRDVKPYAIVAGMPAKLIRYRFDAETIKRLLVSEWWRLDPADLSQVPFHDISEALVEVSTRLKTVVVENQRDLREKLTNKASGSKQGSIWFKTMRGYADPNGLSEFSSVLIEAVNAEIQFQRKPNSLRPGIYPISQAIYDQARGWYRINLAINGVLYQDSIGKGALTFSLLE